MAAWYIRTRAEFFEVLAWTLAIARRRSAGSPLWAHRSIAAQLQAMTDWTLAGRTPAPEERDHINIGLIAIRELDSEPGGEEARFVECLMQLAGYFDEWPDDPPEASTQGTPPGLELLAERRIGLIASGVHLAAGTATRETLRAALDSHAGHVRLAGLADDLNPLVLDPARVEAFVAGLPGQPENVLRRIEGRWLALGVEGLYLSLASPVTAGTIAAGYELQVPDEDSGVVQVSLRVTLEQPYASAVAARARAALAGFEAEVATLEACDATYYERVLAKRRRFAAAIVWRIACRALAPVDSKFRGELELAADACGRYLMPPWEGMPLR